MKIIFIAGPYFGNGTYEEIEKNIQEAEKFAIALANRGIGFFCFATHTRHFEQKANAPEKFYKMLDAEILIRCDAVLALPNWQESPGARAEIEIAQFYLIPIFYQQSINDAEMNAIKEWTKSED